MYDVASIGWTWEECLWTWNRFFSWNFDVQAWNSNAMHGIENSQQSRTALILVDARISNWFTKWHWLVSSPFTPWFSILFIAFGSVLLGQQLAGDPCQTQSSINGQHHRQPPWQVEQLSAILRTKWHRCSGSYGMMMASLPMDCCLRGDMGVLFFTPRVMNSFNEPVPRLME